MEKTPEIEAYWQEYTRSLSDTNIIRDTYHIWHFGNNRRLANELAALVKSGTKTATSTLLWEIEHDHDVISEVGDLVLVTDWDGNPMCVIEIVEVEIKGFNEVDQQFAYDYGEGERTLEWWREAMWGYYEAVCRRIGKSPVEDMLLLCERFRVLYAA
jgi:uncharacterized protein YhfF